MGANYHCSRPRFLRMTLPLILFPVMLFLLASAEKYIGVPKFRYLEPYLMEITYKKGVNHTLYVCCKSLVSYPSFFPFVCPGIQKCPKYYPLSSCETRGQKVRCEIGHVEDKTEVKAYVVYKKGNISLSSSKIASHITNKSERVPNSVANLSVTTNKDQGLNLKWSPLSIWKITFLQEHTYIAECQPLNNNRAKAVRESVMKVSKLTISSRNVTAITKYRCCVLVENVVTSLVSEPLCQNITTTERAPSSSPVILCSGHGSKQCPSKVQGGKRNITVLFKLPSPEDQNGKIVRSEVYYRKTTSANFTKLIINGSMTEAVIRKADTNASYEVFIKSCTNIGCSPISNTTFIPSINMLIEERSHQFPVPIIAVSTAAIILLLLALIYCSIRHQNQLRLKTLPNLKPQTDLEYEYPKSKDGDIQEYHELATFKVTIDGKQVDAIILANSAALAADNNNV
ncbi:uncharacterized protein LOC114523044 [Dendronephthya gigantea]|uniref:uncharacterized protein LOC114523044 n=1 Tax=Dendronephthya gigantea TaxID=151771 RepID=UPI00106D1C1A|nr:uncharacterized protein LOC114523044 [Dendronephthya gigantea]